jgi:glycosyltransferase 2 family protein
MVSIKQIKGMIARPWLRRTALLLFFLIIAALLTKQAMSIEWPKVAAAISAFASSTLIVAVSLAALSYLIYSCFDLLGRHYTRTALPTHRVMKTAFMSYAFNQSLGSLVGGVAFRFRLYSQLGVDAVTISKIILLSVVTNWLGYSAIAGAIFITDAIAMPSGWEIGQFSLRFIGWVLSVTAFAYMLLCGLLPDRGCEWRGQTITVPHLPLAFMQLLLSVVHWPVAAAIIYILLDQQIAFVAVLGALLLSAVAAALAHIPAGVGVLEAIFVALFRNQIPVPQLLATLVIFRAVYYLCPLALASLLYFFTEARSRRPAKHSVESVPHRSQHRLAMRSELR